MRHLLHKCGGVRKAFHFSSQQLFAAEECATRINTNESQQHISSRNTQKRFFSSTEATSTAAATTHTKENVPISSLHHEKPSLLNDVETVEYEFKKFKLSPKFVEGFKGRRPPFGFNGLGEIVYLRTYSRRITDEKGVSRNEEWFETVERVVNGCFNMQKKWIEAHSLGWNPWKAQKSAQEMYTRIFEMKFLPPGRGLWAMGSPLTEQKGIYAALNNCAFVSTDTLKEDPSKPFIFLMDLSMLGVGVGFDTKGAGSITIKGPKPNSATQIWSIPDSREGWVESVKLVLESYFLGKPPVDFDYSKIRAAGMPIKGFGGVSSGPDSLRELHNDIRKFLDREVGKGITVTTIVDIMNCIGKCVVAGNIRRTAEIAFGEYNDEEFIDLKNYEKNPHRAPYGWTSNNSIFAKLGMNYEKVSGRIGRNGEPGFAWLDNMRSYSRMNGIMDNKDHRASGGNPCLEQTLESYELCCLVETFPNNHESLDDYIRTLKMAYLYAKTVTLGKTHWSESNRVMLRNRRIGCSMSGIAQFLSSRTNESTSGLAELQRWCEEGYKAIQHYDSKFSDWLAIPRSIKTTSIKPSGTVSLLAGATPGMHFPESRFYIRRLRLPRDSNLLKALADAGYHIEQAAEDSSGKTMVVEFPVDAGKGIRTANEVSMWEQLCLASFLQRYWADNQVSCTVTFNPETEGAQIQHALNFFQYQLKGVSLLPRFKTNKAYKHMPYEEITLEQYQDSLSKLTPLNLGTAHAAAAGVTSQSAVLVNEEPVPEKYCDGDSCTYDPTKQEKI